MAMDKFLIAPFQSGLQTDMRPWIIPDDAFAELYNAYVFRGRVRKRFGSRLMGTDQRLSRLRLAVGTTLAVSGDFAAADIRPLGSSASIGSMFSVGTTLFTVYQAAGATLTTGTATATFVVATGVLTITGNTENPSTTIYWYPADPVMGLTTYDEAGTAINDQPPIAFDTQFAYTYSNGWFRAGGGTTAIYPTFSGSNLNFFNTANWKGVDESDQAMYVTNFNATIGMPAATDDPMWFYNTADADTYWNTFSAASTISTAPFTTFKSDGSYVASARLIVPFKNCLLLLNTIERKDPAGTNLNFAYPNRMRWSIFGSPLAVETVTVGAATANAPYAYLEPNQTISVTVTVGPDVAVATSKAKGAGYLDATTDEQIVSYEYIKDRLIVFFERSTWEIVWTGNYSQPFYWQKLNTELGCEAQLSPIPFDKNVLSVGNTGVHACNGANVERIDEKIPDIIYGVRNANESAQRTAGIRDYYTEMVYWAYVSRDLPTLQTYPNKVLVYNYKNHTWAINEDSFTCFGYWEQSTDLTWATATMTWAEAVFSWIDNIEDASARQIIAGNMQGWVMILDPDMARNSQSLQITAMSYDATNKVLNLNVINHTLSPSDQSGIGDYVYIENAQGVTIGGDGIYKVISILNPSTGVEDANWVQVGEVPSFVGTYTGGGTLARVSNIQILSKQWNPYDKQSRDVNLSKIDFFVGKTAAGAITVDYLPSSADLSMIEAGGSAGTNSIVGTNVLEMFPLTGLETFQDRLWKPVYFLGEGQSIQLYIYMTDEQITNPEIALSEFELNAMILYTRPTTSRIN